MRRLIETASSEEIYAAAIAAGMRTLYEDGLRHCLGGMTSLEEVRRVAGERRV
jgi:type II secretory ATPase GspE/PulE/Tfp pilus assembly ATPase PilB-like protein